MTAELILPHPAVVVAVSLMKSVLPADVHVSSKMPRTRPEKIVRISRAGGPMANMVTDAPLLIFECWAISSVDAENLANLVRAELARSQSKTIDGAFIRWYREAGGPADFDHPDVTDMSRWQLSGELGIATK